MAVVIIPVVAMLTAKGPTGADASDALNIKIATLLANDPVVWYPGNSTYPPGRTSGQPELKGSGLTATITTADVKEYTAWAIFSYQAEDGA